MTKKILLGIAFVASVAACTDDYKDWATPQVVPAPEAVSFGDGSVSPVDVIEFASIADQQTVKVCNITAPTASDAAYTPSYTITLGEQTYDIAGDGTMAVSDLTSYVDAVYGKAPTQRDIQATVSAWLGNGSTAVKTTTSATFNVSVVPDAPFIDEGYWLVGDFAGWDAAGALAFTHVGSGSVYDAPTFTVTFTTTADGQYWKIIPQNNYDGDFWKEGETGVVGTQVDGDTSLSGSLTTTAPQAGKIEKAGMYKMTIDMMNYTYTIEELNYGPFFYEIGGESGWADSHALYGANNDGKYQGYYYLNGEFKFKPNADNWDGDYEYDGEGKIADNGGANCPDPGAGFYQIDVDLAAGTYNLTLVSSISAIGDFNNWGDDVDLTYNVETGAWEAEGVSLSGGVKFRMNHDWSVSWGGANGDGNNFDDLTQNNGANLNVEEGVYDIQLCISYEGANKVILTKK